MRPLRLLTFTTLFPNREQPNHGIFVENRLRKLVGTGEATSTVMAPVPYFPSASDRFGAWGRYARVPGREERGRLVVHHPRYPVLPRIGAGLAPLLLYLAGLRAAHRLLAGGERFDLIDAHYFYPDGVAAVWLGRQLGLPVVVTARGSDVTLLPQFRVPRRLLRGAVRRAAGLIAVSMALREPLVALGADAGAVEVLRNGVDAAVFRPANRADARASLGLARVTLLSVGHLIERKGHHRVIEAMRMLPDCDLLIVGEGPDRDRLETLVARLGLAARVRLLGPRPHAELAAYYTAADILVLASSREGWANVLLEAMACGTPVVASPIAANSDVVRAAAAGRIAASNTPAGLADSVRALLSAPPDRQATRAYAEQFSWDATTAGQLALFRRVLAHADARAERTPPAFATAQQGRAPT